MWDEYLTGPFGLIAQYSLLKVSAAGAGGGGRIPTLPDSADGRASSPGA